MERYGWIQGRPSEADEEARAGARRERIDNYLERWLPTIRKLIQGRTGQPGFY